jgi:hypothetical protein
MWTVARLDRRRRQVEAVLTVMRYDHVEKEESPRNEPRPRHTLIQVS